MLLASSWLFTSHMNRIAKNGTCKWLAHGYIVCLLYSSLINWNNWLVVPISRSEHRYSASGKHLTTTHELDKSKPTDHLFQVLKIFDSLIYEMLFTKDNTRLIRFALIILIFLAEFAALEVYPLGQKIFPFVFLPHVFPVVISNFDLTMTWNIVETSFWFELLYFYNILGLNFAVKFF
mgnify:CR=1 FL=1